MTSKDSVKNNIEWPSIWNKNRCIKANINHYKYTYMYVKWIECAERKVIDRSLIWYDCYFFWAWSVLTNEQMGKRIHVHRSVSTWQHRFTKISAVIERSCGVIALFFVLFLFISDDFIEQMSENKFYIFFFLLNDNL